MDLAPAASTLGIFGKAAWCACCAYIWPCCSHAAMAAWRCMVHLAPDFLPSPPPLPSPALSLQPLAQPLYPASACGQLRRACRMQSPLMVRPPSQPLWGAGDSLLCWLWLLWLLVMVGEDMIGLLQEDWSDCIWIGSLTGVPIQKGSVYRFF